MTTHQFPTNQFQINRYSNKCPSIIATYFTLQQRANEPLPGQTAGDDKLSITQFNLPASQTVYNLSDEFKVICCYNSQTRCYAYSQYINVARFTRVRKPNKTNHVNTINATGMSRRLLKKCHKIVNKCHNFGTW